MRLLWYLTMPGNTSKMEMSRVEYPWHGWNMPPFALITDRMLAWAGAIRFVPVFGTEFLSNPGGSTLGPPLLTADKSAGDGDVGETLISWIGGGGGLRDGTLDRWNCALFALGSNGEAYRY